MRRRSLSSTSFIRSYNAASILRTLYEKGVCTRSQLTRATRISPATVSRIVTQLVEAGIVRATTQAASSGGRRPALLEIDQTKLHAVGVELRQDQVAMALVNLGGEQVRREAFTPATLHPERLVADLARRVAAMIEEGGVDRASILGVGLAVAGVVERERGMVVRSVNLGWDNVPVAASLEARLDLPVLVENDANAAALAEVWFGRRQERNLMYLKTEAGVGAGIVLEQQPVNGPRGMTGEIGHIPLIQDGHLCRCGQHGCLETYVNVQDVLERYARLAGRALDKEGFFRLALRGDRVASRLVDEAAEALTMAVSFAGALLDVDVVFIGGVWGEFSPAFVERIQQGFQAVVDRTGLEKQVRVRGASLGADTDLMGAAGLVIDDWLNPYSSDTAEIVPNARRKEGMLLPIASKYRSRTAAKEPDSNEGGNPREA